MGRGEVRSFLTPMNERIVGCQGKACGYMPNLFLGLVKSFAKKCEKAVDNCHIVW